MRRRQWLRLAAPLAMPLGAPLLAGCAGGLTAAPAASGADPQVRSATGSDAALIAGLLPAASDGTNTHAILVQRGSTVLAELYFRGTERLFGAGPVQQVDHDADTPHDQRSVTKSVVGLLAGIQHGRGTLGPLDTPVARWFPELQPPAGSAWPALQLRHLLDMTTGWDWDETSLPYSHPNNPDNRMARTADLPAFALSLPFVHVPGTRFNYCGVAPRLMAEVLQRASGLPLRTLADSTLFGPLGIGSPTWRSARDGQPRGDSGLRLTPRQMARIGGLMRDGGRDPQGRQIVPADWVAGTLATRVPAADGMQYGRYWWHGNFAAGLGAGIPFTTAIGNGGQRIAVVPSLDAIVVITAGRYNQPNNGVPSSRLLRRVLAMLQQG